MDILAKNGLTESDMQPHDRVAELEAKLDALTTYQGLTVRDMGGGVYEVVKRTTGAGTEQEPYALTFPVEAQPNAFYSYNGNTYVYMHATAQTETELTEDFVLADWL